MELVKDLDSLVRNDMREPPHLLLYVVEGRFDVPSADNPDIRSRSSSCEMDAGVWSALPEEMVERVLALLPTESQVRCRAVCSRWRHVLASARFQRAAAAAQRARPPPVLCAFEYRPGASRGRCPYSSARVSSPMFITSSGQPKRRVYKLDLTFLPSMFRKWQHNRVVCEDGLVCVKVVTGGGPGGGGGGPPSADAVVQENFCVFNPVTRWWRVLPPLEVRQHRWGVMKVQQAGQGEFRVTLVCGPDNSNAGAAADKHVTQQQHPQHVWYTAVFSSATGAWTQATAGTPAGAPIANCRSVLCSDMVYCMRERTRMMVHALDGATARLGCPPLHLPTPVHGGLGLFEFQLIAHQGQLLLAGQFDAAHNVPSFGIWRLDHHRRWEPVAELPADLHDRLVRPVLEGGHSEISMVSFGGAAKVGDIVFIIMFVTEQPRDFSTHFILKTWTHVVAFNLVERAWQVYFENAGDLVSTVWSTPSGFIELRLNDYL